MMNLATRCTACGTIFRVVQDQLKVSDGWVRCGRCQAVFNAQQGLFDLEREAPPPWQPAATTPEVSDAVPASDTPDSKAALADESGSSDPVSASHESGPEPVASEPMSPCDPVMPPETEHTDVDVGPQSEPGHETERLDYADAELPEDDARTDAVTPAAVTETETVESADAEPARIDSGAPVTDAGAEQAAIDATPSSADEESAVATPEFVRQAERDERWEQPSVRAALVLVAAAAALGLALQITGHYRQRIAAHWPESTAWLQRYCDVFGCRLDALQRIDDVSIESTALTQADAGLQGDGTASALRLAVTLRNRGEVPIAMPSVDLSLTGADGELVSRRALSPADFQVSDPRLKPGIDAPLSVSFSVTGRRVSGYTVEVFYP